MPFEFSTITGDLAVRRDRLGRLVVLGLRRRGVLAAGLFVRRRRPSSRARVLPVGSVAAPPPCVPAEAVGVLPEPRCQTMPKKTVAMAASSSPMAIRRVRGVPRDDVRRRCMQGRQTCEAHVSPCAFRLLRGAAIVLHIGREDPSMTACASSRSRVPTARARRRRRDCWPRTCARSDARSSRCASPAARRRASSVRALVLESTRAARARAEALLFAAARAQLVEDVIAPALARGATVIADRYVGSSLVYQGVVRGVGRRSRARDQRHRHRRPAARRHGAAGRHAPSRRPRGATRRAADRIEREPLEFHRSVIAAYDDVLAVGQRPPRARRRHGRRGRDRRARARGAGPVSDERPVRRA